MSKHKEKILVADFTSPGHIKIYYKDKGDEIEGHNFRVISIEDYKYNSGDTFCIRFDMQCSSSDVDWCNLTSCFNDIAEYLANFEYVSVEYESYDKNERYCIMGAHIICDSEKGTFTFNYKSSLSEIKKDIEEFNS